MRTLTFFLVAALAALAVPAGAAQSQPITTCEPKGPARRSAASPTPRTWWRCLAARRFSSASTAAWKATFRVRWRCSCSIPTSAGSCSGRRRGRRGHARLGRSVVSGPVVRRVQPARRASVDARRRELQLLVVQHGGRESVEYFEVSGRAASGPSNGAAASWRRDDGLAQLGGGAAGRRVRHHPHDRAADRRRRSPNGHRPRGPATSWSGCPLGVSRFSAGARARCPTA